MVGLPNRAGRCKVCKRMKVKCDLARPACSRCRRLGQGCEYIASLQGEVFINRSLTSPFVTAVDIFSNEDKSKLSEKSDPKQATPGAPARKRIPGTGSPKQGIAANIADSSYSSVIHASRILLPALHTHVLLDQHVAQIEALSAIISPYSTTSPMSRTWLPASRVHPCLYHASVFASSASMESLNQSKFSPFSFHHRGLAIRMINEQLSDQTRCNTDEIIAAIIALAGFECITERNSSLVHHVSGMLVLAANRGGLDNLGMDGVLQKLIKIYVWFLDIFCHDPRPRTNLQFLTQNNGPFSKFYTFHRLITLEVSVSHYLLLETPLLSILQDTFCLANDEPTKEPTFMSPTEISSYLSLHCPTPPSTTAPLNFIHRSCHLAVLLYHSPHRHTKHNINQLNTLKGYLLLSDMNGLWLPFPGALLWCLLVGTECATGQGALYSWFASQLVTLWVPTLEHRWEGLQMALEYYGRLLKRRRGNVS